MRNMSTVETVMFFVVLFVGLYLFVKARRYGIKQKAFYEQEAVDALTQKLNGLPLPQYSIYEHRKTLLNKEIIEKSDLQEMQNSIILSCTTSTSGNGNVYRKAVYTLQIDEKGKTIRYFLGGNKFNFKS